MVKGGGLRGRVLGTLTVRFVRFIKLQYIISKIGDFLVKVGKLIYFHIDF